MTHCPIPNLVWRTSSKNHYKQERHKLTAKLNVEEHYGLALAGLRYREIRRSHVSWVSSSTVDVQRSQESLDESVPENHGRG
jgi:hypothetical protein